jgi:hypothetical protein
LLAASLTSLKIKKKKKRMTSATHAALGINTAISMPETDHLSIFVI